MSANNEEREPISKEQANAKRKELVLFIKQFKEYINEQTNIDEQVKTNLLFSVDEILKRAILAEEVVRMADVVCKITKSEEKDNYFKKILCNDLIKIYKAPDISLDILTKSQTFTQAHKTLCDEKSCDCENKQETFL